MDQNTETRRVEITEPGGIKLGRSHFAQGDIKTFDKDVGDMIVDAGWGKDTETGEQGERVEGSVKLEVDSVIQKVAADNV